MKLTVIQERWQLRKPFTISSGSMAHIDTVRVELEDGGKRGRGEAAGVDYRGETVESITTQIESIRGDLEAGLERSALQRMLGAGGARNALDCALWDLECKQSDRTIWDRICPAPRPLVSAVTIGLDSTANMALEAERWSDCPLLKVKIGHGDPALQLRAVHAAAPRSALIVDVNQGWTLAELKRYARKLARLGVKMIEQPLPIDEDEALRGFSSPLILCADESCQTSDDLERLRGLYDMVNIKLDKTGGLTSALTLLQQAKARGFECMVGNMLGTSLAMAPAFVIAQGCQFVDLDGPLLQLEDREHAMQYERGHVSIPSAELWG